MNNLVEILLSFSWAFALAILVVPSIIKVSYNNKLLHFPNHRSVHVIQTPTLGGIAMFTAFASALSLFGTFTKDIQFLFAGGLIIFIVGVQDDLFDVPAIKKLMMQLIPTLLIVVLGDFRITNFHGLLYINELPLILSYLFTIFVVIGITNAINLIDGLDGLAGTLVAFISITFGVYFMIHDDPFAYVAFSLAGAVTGFLKFNLYKAKIFMGDSGSLLSGFIISILAIRFIEINVVNNPSSLAIGIIIIPVFDTIKVFLLRILNGTSPFHPDKNHIHHRLLELGLSQLQVVMVLLGLNVLVTAFMIVNDSLGDGVLIGIMTLGLVFLNNLLNFRLVRIKVNVKENS